MPSGSRVIVRGKRRGRIINGNVKARPGVRPAAVALGDHKTAVLLFNFTNDRSEPWTPAAVEDRFFNAGDSVNTFFQEQSWNQVSLSGAVYGWYELGIKRRGCNEDSYAAAAGRRHGRQRPGLLRLGRLRLPRPARLQLGGPGRAARRPALAERRHQRAGRFARARSQHGRPPRRLAALHEWRRQRRDQLELHDERVRRPVLVDGHVEPADGRLASAAAGLHPAANVQTVTTSGTYSLSTTATQSSGAQILKIPRTPAGSPRSTTTSTSADRAACSTTSRGGDPQSRRHRPDRLQPDAAAVEAARHQSVDVDLPGRAARRRPDVQRRHRVDHHQHRRLRRGHGRRLLGRRPRPTPRRRAPRRSPAPSTTAPTST